MGLHLKSLRANVDALETLAELHERRGPRVENVVALYQDVRDDAGEARLAQLSTAGAARVIRHDPMDDDTLHAHVSGLDVSLMAYAWGTHSGVDRDVS